MKQVLVKYVDKDGLSLRLRSVAQAPYERVSVTVPAKEALLAVGALVAGTPEHGYQVQLVDRCPKGLVATRNADGNLQLRLNSEPQYPVEFDSYWEQLDFTPCPKCGGVLVWYEAGYVPGYRVCAQKPHHHVRPYSEEELADYSGLLLQQKKEGKLNIASATAVMTFAFLEAAGEDTSGLEALKDGTGISKHEMQQLLPKRAHRGVSIAAQGVLALSDAGELHKTILDNIFVALKSEARTLDPEKMKGVAELLATAPIPTNWILGPGF